MKLNLDEFVKRIEEKNPNEPEFVQSVKAVAANIIPYVNERNDLLELNILERLVEPERSILFQVTWVDDSGTVHVNKGYRVQMSSSLGPYKGGLRFHPSVNLSIMKFLAFEQTFKNSLTGLSLGSGKGGADFDPTDRSDLEIMRFCQAFVSELYRHIGAELDVPAGDIGVSEREVGYMFGKYKKLRNEFTGVITGKGPSWGGSLVRKEATGYGVIYFLELMLKRNDEELKGQRICISGAGNVSRGAAHKAIESGAKVLAVSNINGTLYDSDGFTKEMIDELEAFKAAGKRDLKEFASKHNLEYIEKSKPWSIECDVALPCATQNELEEKDAQELIKNGCRYVVEGANMPSTADAIRVFRDNSINYAPGKAANAGGVAVSGLEMAQNKLGYSWTSEEVDGRLKDIMRTIHDTCVRYGKSEDSKSEGGEVDYVKGADIGGFVKVADAMKAQGIL